MPSPHQISVLEPSGGLSERPSGRQRARERSPTTAEKTRFLAADGFIRPLRDETEPMPAVLKYAIVAAIVSALSYVTLYVFAVHFEPEQTEVRKSLPSVKIQR
ncbi:MAG: hypothetical protein AAFY27_02405 [Pseudomonadota bacterium]